MNPLDSQLSNSLSSPSEKKISALSFELKRLSLFFLSLILLLCLVSHQKEDPSFSTWSSETKVQNWMGSFGSVVSDFLFQSIGYTSYLLTLTLFGLALKMPFRDLRGKKIKFFGFTLLILFFSSFLVLTLDRSHHNAAQQSGGLLGQGLCYLMIQIFGTTGSFLVSVFAILVALICLFEWEVVSLSFKFTKHFFKQTLPKIFKRENFKISFPVKQENTASASPPPTPPGLLIPPPPIATHPTLSTVAKLEQNKKALDIEIAEPLAPQKITKSKSKPPSIQSHYQLPSLNLISGKAESKSKSVDPLF